VIPSGYQHGEREAHWVEQWRDLYRWDPTRPREETFVVDTPPPTVSGSLHMGHVFSYTQQDVLVRFQRMRGKNIAYPMGWDDNGLPTERRVQNLFRIQCNPRLAYDPNWQPREGKGPFVEVSRQNFIEACGRVTQQDEAAFEDLWRRLGLSVDWSQQYATIDERCRRISQRSFLELLEKGQAYHAEAPTMWDVDFRTAVAQAEVEERIRVGHFHDIRFEVEGGGQFTITTTRPELLPACIAVAAHPDDERYRPLFGKHALTPLFRDRVPIVPAEHADPEKGTGILMICTFGDSADVEFWKKSDLPLKQILGSDGRVLPRELENPKAQDAYDELVGLSAKEARKHIVALLAADLHHGESSLVNAPREVEHPVKFYEKGERPLEFIPTRQWFVRLLEHKPKLLEMGRRIEWHPQSMRVRYDHWVEGLNQDWCVSRQRYFGVPFPLWYRLDDQGEPDYANPITAQQLPVDPMSQVPPGYTEAQRDQPGGFTGEPDVMDTWATSSLTPQILSGWGDDEEKHARLFPADIRPQSHEIIRTWAFYTIVKGFMHHAEIPWRHVLISGWILDPDRKKMSKSAGNVISPVNLMAEHSADGLRYWASRARLGADTAFDEGVLKLGRRLATKLFNAARFVYQQETPAESMPLDQARAVLLKRLVDDVTNRLEAFDYAGALAEIETSFWDFCDNYLELVKRRPNALRPALEVYLRLFAPYLPFVTEEVWSWTHEGSIHLAPWPEPGDASGDPQPYLDAVDLLAQIRGAKTTAKKSLRWPVKHLRVRGAVSGLASVLDDVLAAGAVEAHELEQCEMPVRLDAAVELS